MSPRRVGGISGAVAIVPVAIAGVALGVSVANTIAVGGLSGLFAGLVASRIAAVTYGRDGAERLLAFATAGLPPGRADWGAAMRSELAAIDDADARRRFARSAAAAAFGRGLGLRIAIAMATGVVVAAIVVMVSRAQLRDGGPGVLDVTVPIPAFLLLGVALMTAYVTRSFRIGLETGTLSLVASFAAVFTVVALEGLVWMDRRGVFVLDADAPRAAVGDVDVVLDFFTTGMWLGHVIFWVPWLVMGAWIGSRRGDAASRGASRLA